MKIISLLILAVFAGCVKDEKSGGNSNSDFAPMAPGNKWIYLGTHSEGTVQIRKMDSLLETVTIDSIGEEEGKVFYYVSWRDSLYKRRDSTSVLTFPADTVLQYQAIFTEDKTTKIISAPDSIRFSQYYLFYKHEIPVESLYIDNNIIPNKKLYKRTDPSLSGKGEGIIYAEDIGVVRLSIYCGGGIYRCYDTRKLIDYDFNNQGKSRN